MHMIICKNIICIKSNRTHTIRKCKKMAGQNTFQMMLICPELTQILDLKEAETHYGKGLIMAHS